MEHTYNRTDVSKHGVSVISHFTGTLDKNTGHIGYLIHKRKFFICSANIIINTYNHIYCNLLQPYLRLYFLVLTCNN